MTSSEWLAADDCAAWQTVLDHTYNQTTLTPVIVADGYSIQFKVENGQLVIIDGVGTHLRRRVIPRANRTVRRLVVLGRAGTLTLAALRWCTDVGISVSVIDPDGTLTAITASPNPNDARLRRAQAAALGTPVGTAIAAKLISSKLDGQASVLTYLGCGTEAGQIQSLLTLIEPPATKGLDKLREVEAAAANIYFSKWSTRVSAQFANNQQSRVPAHWLSPMQRSSPLVHRRSPRRAAHPVNALLNYAYTLGEAAVRQACLTVGLDSALGVMHSDKKHRDSLALDILEPLRPRIDLDVIQLLASRRFRRLDFTETHDGQCKLTETTTHQLASYLPTWAATIAPTVEWVAHTLADAAPAKIGHRTPLTQQHHLDARTSPTPKRGVKPPTPPETGPTCRECGSVLQDKQAVICQNCWPEVRTTLATQRVALAVAARRQKAADTGQDPSQTPAARARRSGSLKEERAQRDQWDHQHAGERHNKDAFIREVLPGLVGIPLSRITRATGISTSGASKMRSGLLVPHPRHWLALSQLVNAEADGAP